MSEDQISTLIAASVVGGIFLLVYGFFIWKFWHERDMMRLSPYQRSWIALLGLNIVTLGGYYVYWYLQTSRILNRKAKKPISINFQIIAVLVLLANIAIVFFVEDDSRGTALVYLSRFADRMALGVMMIWAFEIRRVLGETLPKRPNAVLTFFFGCLYLHQPMRKWLDLDHKAN